MKKVIITLVTILVILIIVLCYINIKTKNKIDDELELQEKLYLNGINNPGLVIDGLTPSEVKVDNIFFTVEECIKTYINYDGNVKKVANELFVHRNTINNKMRKINEITGINPITLDGKVLFSLAIKISELYGL